jgi:hypothetical protein
MQIVRCKRDGLVFVKPRDSMDHNPRNLAEIRAGIVRIVEDSAYRRTLIDRGFENLKRFTASVVADLYVALYQRVLRHRDKKEGETCQ